jgi:hypothetical protein
LCSTKYKFRNTQKGLSTEIPQQGFHMFYSEVLCVMKELYCSLSFDLLACLSNGGIRKVAMTESSPHRPKLQLLTSPATLPSQQWTAGLFEFIPTPKPALIAELGNKHRPLVVLRPINAGVPIICVLYKTKTPSSFVCLYHSVSDFYSGDTVSISADMSVIIGFFMDVRSLFRKIPERYVDYATTASCQILLYLSCTSHLNIRRYIIWDIIYSFVKRTTRRHKNIFFYVLY